MTTKTTKLTNTQALAIAADVAATNPDAFTRALHEVNPDATVDELAEKLNHMHEQACKVSNHKYPKAPSKASIENRQFAEKLIAELEKNPGQTFTLKWVMEHVDFVSTSQKASAIVTVLLNDGRIEKAEPVKGRVAYKLAEN